MRLVGDVPVDRFALVTVSHDRRLRDRFTGEVRVMCGGRLLDGGSLAA